MRNLKKVSATDYDLHFSLFNDLKRDQVVTRTLDNYNREWLNYTRFSISQLSQVEISVQMIQGYLDQLSKTRNTVGVWTAWRHLRPFINYLQQEEVVKLDLSQLRLPKESREQKHPLTDQQVLQMLKAAQNPRDYAIIYLIYDTGLGSRELRELEPKHIDWESRLIWISVGKNGQSRCVPFSSPTLRALRAWSAVRDPETRWFFHNADHEYSTQMSMWHLSKTISRIAERAGITEPVGPHRLRHTFARAFISGGGDVFSLRQMLGHSSLDVSMQYVKLYGEDLQKKHRQFSPANNLQNRSRDK